MSLLLPPKSNTDKAKTITIEVHGLKAKIQLNRPEEDLIPADYLQKAAQTPSTNRPIWLFRGREDARGVNLNRWSTVDTRFRGVYKTLKKVPAQFASGIYEDGSPEQSSSSSSSSSRINFTEAAKAQGQVVYALLHEILDMMRIGRRMGDASFVLRPRLFNCKLEYWTGYRERYTDGPRTAELLCIDAHPETGLVRAVVPISSPHGPKLHLLRGIFPGHKTSRLWSGRYNNPASASGPAGANPPPHCFAATDPCGSRYYGGANMKRVRQELEWMALCCAGNGGEDEEEEEADARTFRLLGSREFDLWVGRDFRDEEENKKKEVEKKRIVEEEKKNLETMERLAREEVQEDAISQSWWDWVWEEGHGDWIPQDEDDLVINGP
ncbi:hypothetical protein BDW42DRAFT_196850 [Aspergillus taichungensis]|uniref:Uncharacterized protein n=1 Tax=Aspergillus taichungensis TaxID=482145 RepID=A0A2J5HIT3_9EURO|nr:hypothetical protein BDW42DRAFT_196850 [Aspergillus taichungensis]